MYMYCSTVLVHVHALRAVKKFSSAYPAYPYPWTLDRCVGGAHFFFFLEARVWRAPYAPPSKHATGFPREKQEWSQGPSHTVDLTSSLVLVIVKAVPAFAINKYSPSQIQTQELEVLF